MKKIASLRKSRFALIFSLTFIAGVLLTTILLLANNPLRGWCSKQFSLTTWNVADVVTKNVFFTYHDRFQIGWIQGNISDNITVLQEDFYTDIYNGVKGDYNYGKTFGSEGRGLSFLSQFYIHSHLFQEWRTHEGLDLAANKGFAFAVIYIPVTNSSGWTCEFPLHVYTLHANAGDSRIAQIARDIQLFQLHSFMIEHSLRYSVIVAGDFNLDYSNNTHKGLLEDFKAAQKLTMANDSNFITHKDGKMFDYILFRAGDYRESLEVTNCNVESSIFVYIDDPYSEPRRRRSSQRQLDRKGEVEDSGGPVYIFSDHYPVTAHFKYSVDYDAFPDLVVSDILQVTYDTSSGKGRAFVLVKNNGPAAIDKTKLDIECLHREEAPRNREYKYRGEMRTPELEENSYAKFFLGSGTIPQLNSGQSAIVEVSLNNLNNYIKTYRQSWKIDIIATANKPRAIRENNDFNNILQKRIDVVEY
jgi:hypothetical protein